MTKLYNFQVRIPFVFDADIQLTRQVHKGVPFMEAWCSSHDSVEVCMGSVWAVISADKTPMVSAVAAMGWITLVGLTAQSVVTLLA